jgi:predicted ester cyclase
LRFVDVNSSKPVPVSGMSVTGARAGVVGAFVLQFDEHGLVRTAAQYMDGTTYAGQVAPKMLPDSVIVRPAVSGPPFGTSIFESKGTAQEVSNVEAEKALLAAATQHDVDGLVRRLAPSHLYDDYRTGGAMNNDSLRSTMATVFAAFPDWKVGAISMQCAAGNYVITQYEDSGTWRGQFLGRDPSNKTFRGSELLVHEFQNGVPVHAYSYGDSDGVLRQIRFWKDPGADSSSSGTARGHLVSPTPAGGH